MRLVEDLECYYRQKDRSLKVICELRQRGERSSSLLGPVKSEILMIEWPKKELVNSVEQEMKVQSKKEDTTS